MSRYLRRVKVAAWLAWNALRGRAVDIEVGGPDGIHEFVGVQRAFSDPDDPFKRERRE